MNPLSLFIVEDNAKLRSALQSGLEATGEVRTSSPAKAARRRWSG